MEEMEETSQTEAPPGECIAASSVYCPAGKLVDEKRRIFCRHSQQQHAGPVRLACRQAAPSCS